MVAAQPLGVHIVRPSVDAAARISVTAPLYATIHFTDTRGQIDSVSQLRSGHAQCVANTGLISKLSVLPATSIRFDLLFPLI